MMARAAGLAVLLALVLAASVDAQGYAAGVGVRDITPTASQIADQNMYMSGFGGWQHRKPTGVHDQLWARALVLSANGTVMATLALDLLGLGGTTAREIANGVHRATEGVIAVDAVLVCSTHTHSGPDLQGLWGYAPDDYREMVVKRSIEAILEAFRSQRQARLRLSATSVPAFNRRGWGETDEEVTVLDIWDALSKTRIGLVINFGAHPNTIHSHGVVEDSLQISSDFCHYVRTNVEAAIGNGAPVLFFNGIQGDVDALGGGHGFARPRDYGTRISNAVIASLRNQEEIAGAPSLVFRSRQYRQIVTNNDFLNAMRSGALPDYLMPPGVNSLTLTVAYFSIGTALQAVTSPGESLTQNGLPAKRAMAAKYHMFLGLTTDAIGYLVPEDEWGQARLNDGYEESMSIDRSVGDVTRDLQIVLIKADNPRISGHRGACLTPGDHEDDDAPVPQVRVMGGSSTRHGDTL